ncbi:MAG: tRNA dihydrouridine synthase DusB [Nannocystaceae bacterium]
MDEAYVSDINRGVPPAADGEFQPLQFGGLRVWPPVVLAPMAGVTNYPFRSLCRSFGAGLYVSEMVTAGPLVRGDARSDALARFGDDEHPRSLQLYGIDPTVVGEAVRRLVGEARVDHLDMNFGCPVPKVTRKGGGAALPLKWRLLRDIVRAAVSAAGQIPVTIKVRMGIDEEHLSYLRSGEIARDEGCAAIGLHARTAAQFYAGEARWDAIATLKQHVPTLQVLGNGDVWEAHDALRMMRHTGCDGIIVGRGCLGRPWLFRDLAQIFEGHEPDTPPPFGHVADTMLRHLRAALAWFATPDDPASERATVRAFRKHAAWYTKGFRGGANFRAALMQVESLAALEALVSQRDRDEPFPPDAMRAVRGKSGRRQRVALPAGYLAQLEDASPPSPEAEIAFSGG